MGTVRALSVHDTVGLHSRACCSDSVLPDGVGGAHAHARGRGRVYVYVCVLGGERDGETGRQRQKKGGGLQHQSRAGK